MLALILFAVVEEDVDEFAASAVEDMEVSTTLDKAAVGLEASAAAALQAACIFFCLWIIDLYRRKQWQMEICRTPNIMILETRTRSIRPLLQYTVIIEICENILLTSIQFCNEFSHFFLQLLNWFLLSTTHEFYGVKKLLCHYCEIMQQYCCLHCGAVVGDIDQRHWQKSLLAEGVKTAGRKSILVDDKIRRKREKDQKEIIPRKQWNP